MEPATGETHTGLVGFPGETLGGLLEVPGLSSSWDGDEEEDEEETCGGIKPKSSPCPRRKSSVSSEDSEPELPPSRSRRVSFADVLGLSLVSVKEFDSWDVPRLPGDFLEGDRKEVEEYYLSTLFPLPLPSEELALRVRDQKLELESVELFPGSPILRGVIRVLNLSFDKMLYVRTSLDAWESHFDLLAEYVPESGDGVTDCFSFKLTLVPPFGSQGARVDFCLRYETPIGTFWANNRGKNYVLFCHQKVKETKEKLQSDNAQKKSCLKAISQIFTTEEHWSSTDAEHTGASKPDDNIPVPNIDSKETPEDVKQKLRPQDTVRVEPVARLQKLSHDWQRWEEKPARVMSRLTGSDSLVENRQNCIRRNRRQEARMARVRDYFSQRDDLPNENKDKAVDPSQPLTEQNTLPMKSFSNGPETQPQHNTSERHETQSDSMATSDKAGRPSTNKDEGTQGPRPITSDLVGSEVTMFSDNQTALMDEHAPSCQTDDMPRVMASATVEDRGELQGTDEGCLDDVASSAGSSNQTRGVTFGTVLAPLYHQVFCQSESDRVNLSNKRNQTSLSKGKLHDGKPATGLSQRYTSTQEVGYALNLTSDAGETHEELAGIQKEPLESDAGETHVELAGIQKEPLESDAGETRVELTGIQKEPLESDAGETHVELTGIQKEPLESDAGETHVELAGIQKEPLESDAGETHVELTGIQKEPLESDADCSVLGVSVQSKPVSDEGDRCVPRTVRDAVAPWALTPAVPQGPSEVDNLPQQAKKLSSAQIPPEVTSTQKQTAVATISTSAQSDLDMVGLRSQTLVRVPENDSPDMIPQANWGPDSVSIQQPEERENPLTVSPGEHPTETDRLHKATVMSEFKDYDLTVESSTHQIPNNPSIESKPSVTTLKANYCAGAAEKDEPVYHKVDSEKQSDKEEDRFQSDNRCGETNLSTEGEGGGNIYNTKDVIEYDSKSKEGDELFVMFTERDVKSVEDHDGSSEDPSFDERQKCGNQNLDEKDWEKIVEEEEDMLLDEDREEENETDQEEKERCSDERADTVLEEMMEKMVEQENILVEEKEQEEEIYVDECRAEEIKEREVALAEKEVEMGEGKVDERGVEMGEGEEDERGVEMREGEEDERGVEINDRGVEIEVEGLKDEMKEEDYDEKQLEEEEIVAEEEEMVEEGGEEEMVEEEGEEEIEEQEDREELLIGGETDEVVEIGERDEYADREQDQIEGETQHEAADHFLSAEHKNSAFESGSEDERVNANNSKNTDSEDNRWKRSKANLYIVQDAPRDDCDHDDDRYSMVREDIDSVVGDEPLRAGKPCHEDGDERSVSSESLSDDEMDLYLRSLKAAQKQGAGLATAGCSKDTPGATNFGKRPSISRSKHLPSPMPSISESVDEEQPDDALEDLLDFEKVEEPPGTSPFEREGGLQNNLAWWRETFSFQNISKALMFSFLLVVFSVVAYHYDFLACSALYLLSVLWLCCQGEKQTERDNRVQESTSPEPVSLVRPSV